MSYFSSHLALLVLVFSFCTQALPFTPKGPSNHRDADAQWNLGKLNQMASDPPDVPPSGNTEYTGGTGYECSCDHDRPPAKMIANLKDDISLAPHPMFLLSEMADGLHQKKACSSLCEGVYSKQLEETIVAEVRSIFMHYLNTSNAHSSAYGPCQSWYNVTFNPDHYPRYIVEIVCSDPLSESPEKAPSCSFCSNDKDQHSISGHCIQYELEQMQILTRNPNEQGCKLPDGDPPHWRRCHLLRVVGMGCKCAI